jgi:hypothetical protein
MFEVDDKVSKLIDKIGEVLNNHSTKDAIEALMVSMVILFTMCMKDENRLTALRSVFKQMRIMIKDQIENEKKMMQ